MSRVAGNHGNGGASRADEPHHRSHGAVRSSSRLRGQPSDPLPNHTPEAGRQQVVHSTLRTRVRVSVSTRNTAGLLLSERQPAQIAPALWDSPRASTAVRPTGSPPPSSTGARDTVRSPTAPPRWAPPQLLSQGRESCFDERGGKRFVGQSERSRERATVVGLSVAVSGSMEKLARTTRTPLARSHR